jgi:hypothetical protein
MFIPYLSCETSRIQDGRQYGRRIMEQLNTLYVGNQQQQAKSQQLSNPSFSTVPESIVTLPTFPNVGRLVQFQMADCKPEVHRISILWNGMFPKFQQLTTHFRHIHNIITVFQSVNRRINDVIWCLTAVVIEIYRPKFLFRISQLGLPFIACFICYQKRR